MIRQQQRAFERNHAQAQRSAREQLRIILANADKLKRAKKGAQMLEAATSFEDILARGGRLTPNQLSYVDGIYEQVMKCAGFDSVGLHTDRKRKGLRYE